jgi:hypothetical protein
MGNNFALEKIFQFSLLGLKISLEHLWEPYMGYTHNGQMQSFPSMTSPPDFG